MKIVVYCFEFLELKILFLHLVFHMKAMSKINTQIKIFILYYLTSLEYQVSQSENIFSKDQTHTHTHTHM
jgi:hypothetical protein